MNDNIVTSQNYYMFNGVKIGFFFDEEEDGYILSEAKGQLDELFVPNTVNGKPVKDINGDIFYTLTGFNKVSISEENLNFTTVDGVLFTKGMKKLVIYPPERKDEVYLVPKGVEEIGEDSFCNRFLKTLVLQTGVKYIIQYSINCRNLETLYIPKTLEKVYFKAFAGCDLIKTVYYQGVEEEWNNIDFTDFNKSVTKAEIRFNHDYSSK